MLPRKSIKIYTGSVNISSGTREALLKDVRGGGIFMALVLDLVSRRVFFREFHPIWAYFIYP